LSKTTLEKPEAIRYKPASDGLTLSNQPVLTESIEDIDLPALTGNQNATVVPLSSYVHGQGSDSLFEQAVWHIGEGAGLEYQGSAVVGQVPTNILAEVSGKKTPDATARSMQETGCVTLSISALAPEIPPQESHARLASANTILHQVYSGEHFGHEGFFDGPTSSELMLWTKYQTR
jgi:hypothetical protein